MAERSHRRVPRLAAAVSLTVLLMGSASCNYSFRGGSFPDHIRTVAVLPFENETSRLELTQELYDVMLRDLPRALGVRSGSETNADAVIRGAIRSYDLRAPDYRAGADGERAEVLQREVVMTVEVQLVDRVQNVILWEDRSLRTEGQYLEASENEEIGKQVALELLVQRIVDGAQSNW